ncbi:MAG: hypothetical protein KJP00_07860, partial [Bacteroidia bacterium]|nr:hypothetical protein [Bacteroidia bacterium]
QMQSEGKTGKYLTYAIGEILLVVVGILLALQINNWNEARKDAILERDLLQNLQQDINYNASRIQAVRFLDSTIMIKNRILLDVLTDPGSTYHDSLQTHFGNISRYDVFAPRKMAYEALKSKGLEIIKNDSLRSEIIKLYDESYGLNAVMIDLKRDIHMNSSSIHNKRLFTLQQVDYKIPVDFGALKSDTEFINDLSYVTAESLNFLWHYQNMYNKSRAVEQLITNELKR